MCLLVLSNTTAGNNVLVLLILQTFVNDVRIQEQMYITLKLEDKLRFGYDILSRSAPSHTSIFYHWVI